MGFSDYKIQQLRSGAATHINYMWTDLRHVCYHSPLTYIGWLHIVSFSSLHLSTSHPFWLELSPTLGM